MKTTSAFGLITILIFLIGCSSKAGLPVGSPCTTNSECNEGVCADAASGFVNGYCTGPCERNDPRPVDLRNETAICAWVMGETRWISTCTYNTRNETGYQCTSSQLYFGDVLIPDCRQDDDCRGCACPSDYECSPAHGWKCVQSAAIGEPCTLESDICEHACIITREGSGQCSDGNPPSFCFRRADCVQNNACTVETELEEKCESHGTAIDLFDVCYMVPVQPLVEGQCIKWLGSTCENSEDCAAGTCYIINTTTGAKVCTSSCDAWGDGAAVCESMFQDERATCCYNVGNMGIDLCTYEAPGSGCQWTP